MRLRHLLVCSSVLLALGCDGGPTADAGTPPIDGSAPGADSGTAPRTDGGGGDGGGQTEDAGTAPTDAGSGGGVTSTLTITCDGELSGRAIVNHNTNLGIAFTDPAPGFASRGSISFDFPAGFAGSIANPEVVDGGPRHTLAITDRAFTTYGNHCWPFDTAPRSGSGVIEQWRPTDGVVRATFVDFPLRNCVTMSDTCVLNGTIETTGEGVFD